jgi:hypothetical protein
LASLFETDEHRQARIEEEAVKKARQDSIALAKEQQKAVAKQAKAEEEAMEKVRQDSIALAKKQQKVAAARQKAQQDAVEFARLSDYEKEQRWTKAVIPKADLIAAWAMAQEFVKEVLPTPDSVEFPWGYEGKVQTPDIVWEYEGKLFRQYEVHTTFSAQNRYGATIRYELNCWLYTADNKHWTRLKMNITDPSLKWSDPEYWIFRAEFDESNQPRRAKMPEGWTPNK